MDGPTQQAIRRALAARGRDAPDGRDERDGRDEAAVERIGRLLDGAGGRARSIDDADYPARIRSLSRPPDVLFLAGPWDPAGPVVAVVGSRNATADGVDLAREIAEDLAARGAAVVSGLALGIDAAAHEGALAAGGRSGAALGTGLERCYPPEHEALQGALARSLGLLSEVLPGDPPRRSTFASRNRLLAALADAVVIVQGDAASGALLTVEAAESLGRPIGAVPWDPREVVAAAPHALIRDGRATLVRGADDVIALLDPDARGSGGTPRAAGRASGSAGAAPPGAAALDAPSSRVLASLRRRAESLDDLAARAGLPAAVTAAALLALELDGRARREPGGRYRLVRSR